ncbi:Pheromone shutdown [Trema orientale]|uniref:Pheromone shutdown n=1 Tax=Trema orientale TaxID=63057 RepID=A0A2P5F660_TREOI|nr:Pheromone shutdown [Trema orientale]
MAEVMKKNEDYVPLFRMAWAKFRVAYEEAIKYGGKVILGDRAMKITLKRTWGKMSHWDKIKLPFSLISLALRKKYIEQRMTSEKMPFWRRIMPISLSFQKDLPSQKDLKKVVKERLDDVNGEMLALMMEEIKKRFPTVVETCIHERDLKHSSVVAVVGKGHLQGIKRHWKQPIVLKELLEITSEKAAVCGACKDT